MIKLVLTLRGDRQRIQHLCHVLSLYMMWQIEKLVSDNCDREFRWKMYAIYLEEEIDHRISVCIGMPFESLQAIVVEHDLEGTGSVGINQ